MSYKFDCHCHVHEGSPDSKVAIKDYIDILISKGFSGMLVTDHDSYGGFEYWKSSLKDCVSDTFSVLRGIEYDTWDGGHFIVVMPEGCDAVRLTHKGLSVKKLIEYVHENGGILGPAHGFSEPFLSLYRTGRYKFDKSITSQFDFIEGFNACEHGRDNERACAVAKEYGLPTIGGSDAHWEKCVGEGYTSFSEPIKGNDDFIAYIKSGKPVEAGGNRYIGTTRDKLGRFNKLLVYGFFPYNKLSCMKHKVLHKFDKRSK